VQTFLPYADFEASARSLDPARLGKQRVEVLQILRAITFPSYGWTNHPATIMWRGYVPALTSYGLAMVDAWTKGGAGDTTRSQIAEFAPGADGVPAPSVPLPLWLGNEALHRSHQSNLLRKSPEFYGPRFPGVPADLPYVWPGQDAQSAPEPLLGAPLVIFRPRDDTELVEWIERGNLALGENSPAGKRGPKWLRQLELFAALPTGSRFAALEAAGQQLRTGEITSEVAPFASDRGPGLRRSARFDGELARAEFPYPALLQDPRTLFETVGPLAL
jgi:Pyrimidine dimer DNA glycosylase